LTVGLGIEVVDPRTFHSELRPNESDLFVELGDTAAPSALYARHIAIVAHYCTDERPTYAFSSMLLSHYNH